MVWKTNRMTGGKFNTSKNRTYNASLGNKSLSGKVWVGGEPFKKGLSVRELGYAIGDHGEARRLYADYKRLGG